MAAGGEERSEGGRVSGEKGEECARRECGGAKNPGIGHDAEECGKNDPGATERFRGRDGGSEPGGVTLVLGCILRVGVNEDDDAGKLHES